MSPAEHGEQLARSAAPLTDEQVEAGALIFASIEEQAA